MNQKNSVARSDHWMGNDPETADQMALIMAEYRPGWG